MSHLHSNNFIRQSRNQGGNLISALLGIFKSFSEKKKGNITEIFDTKGKMKGEKNPWNKKTHPRNTLYLCWQVLVGWFTNWLPLRAFF